MLHKSVSALHWIRLFHCIPVHITHNHPGKVFAWTDCGVQHICQTIGAVIKFMISQSCHITAQISKHPQFGASVSYTVCIRVPMEKSPPSSYECYLYSHFSCSLINVFSRANPPVSCCVPSTIVWKLFKWECRSWVKRISRCFGSSEAFTWYPVNPETLSININVNANAFF